MVGCMTRRLSCLVAALALAGAIAGCGGGDDEPDDAVASLDEEAAADDGSDDDGGGGASNIDDAEFEDAMLEYAQCMRDNGIDMPDPEFDGDGGGGIMINGGPDDEGPGEELEAAEEVCGPIIEDARPDMDLDPEEQAELQDQLVAVAECMRGRGHDMPDPEVSADGGVRMRAGGPGEGGAPNEEFEQDIEECHEEAGMESPEGRGPAVGNGSGGA
jgi:hypothetical protein